MIFPVLEAAISDTLLSFMQAVGLPQNEAIMFVLLLFISYAVFFLALRALLPIFKYISSKTKTTFDDDLLRVAEKYSWWLPLLLSLFLAVEIVYPNTTIGGYGILQIFIMAFMVFFAFFIAEVADIFLVWYGMSIQPKERKGVSPKQVFPFVRTMVKITIYLVFLVFVLQYAGFDTAALLTGLGVAGLAVALALQDTLGNFFAGLHLLIDKPFREGDYISLEPGMEGHVDRIGWRTTKIILPDNNELIVPNSKLAGAIIQNFANPDKSVVVFYEIGVSYDSDVEKVEKTIIDVINKVAKKNQYLVPDTAFARLDRFGDYALIFKFGYRVNGYINRFSVLKDVNKELLSEFRKNKIEIPFPVRVMMKK